MSSKSKVDAPSKTIVPIYTSQGPDSSATSLQALDVQELSTYDEDDKPVLLRVTVDTAVVCQGAEKLPPFYAFVRELHWDAKTKQASATLAPLVRASEIDLGSEKKHLVPSLVFLSTETQTLPAWRIMHPCEVFFLQASDHPVAMVKVKGKTQEHIRFGLICCGFYDNASFSHRPFQTTTAEDTNFAEACRLLQLTNKKLQALELKENVPPRKRTGPLKGIFAPFQVGGAAPPRTGTRLTQNVNLATAKAEPKAARSSKQAKKSAPSQPSAASQPPKTAADVAKPALESGSGMASDSSRDVPMDGTSQPVDISTKQPEDRTLGEMDTMSSSPRKKRRRGEQVSSEATSMEEASEGMEVSQDTAKRAKTEADSEDDSGDSDGGTTEQSSAAEEVAGQRKESQINEIANELAMSLELEAFGDTAFQNISTSIQKLMTFAGPLSLPVSSTQPDSSRNISVVQLHTLRKQINMPAALVIKRIAQAANAAPLTAKRKMAAAGFYNLMGAYLHGSQIPAPPKTAPPSVVALLSVLEGSVLEETLAPAAVLSDADNEWAAWIVQNKLMSHLDALKDSAHPKIREAATATKSALQRLVTKFNAGKTGAPSIQPQAASSQIEPMSSIPAKAPPSVVAGVPIVGRRSSRKPPVNRAPPSPSPKPKSQPKANVKRPKRGAGPSRLSKVTVASETESDEASEGGSASLASSAGTSKTSRIFPSATKTPQRTKFKQKYRDLNKLTREAPRMSLGESGDPAEAAKRFEAAAKAKQALVRSTPSSDTPREAAAELADLFLNMAADRSDDRSQPLSSAHATADAKQEAQVKPEEGEEGDGVDYVMHDRTEDKSCDLQQKCISPGAMADTSPNRKSDTIVVIEDDTDDCQDTEDLTPAPTTSLKGKATKSDLSSSMLPRSRSCDGDHAPYSGRETESGLRNQPLAGSRPSNTAAASPARLIQSHDDALHLRITQTSANDGADGPKGELESTLGRERMSESTIARDIGRGDAEAVKRAAGSSLGAELGRLSLKASKQSGHLEPELGSGSSNPLVRLKARGSPAVVATQPLSSSSENETSHTDSSDDDFQIRHLSRKSRSQRTAKSGKSGSAENQQAGQSEVFASSKERTERSATNKTRQAAEEAPQSPPSQRSPLRKKMLARRSLPMSRRLGNNASGPQSPSAKPMRSDSIAARPSGQEIDSDPETSPQTSAAAPNGTSFGSMKLQDASLHGYTLPVHANFKRPRKKQNGRYNAKTNKILTENGKVVDLQTFCKLAGVSDIWEQVIYVKQIEGHKTQLLHEWITNKCKVCHKPDDPSNMLMCDNLECEELYHCYCLQPKLSSPPEGKWFCPQCVAKSA